MKTFELEGIEKAINFYNYKINVIGKGIYDTENPNTGNNRFHLELEIKEPKKNKSLIVIMMNPSKTFPKRKEKKSQIDKTIQNVIKIAYVCGYNKIYIKNIFSLINPNSKIQYYENPFNKKELTKFLDKNKYDTLIAWGKDKEQYTQDILKCLKDRKLFVWTLTEDKKPMHPSPRNNPKIKEFLQRTNPKLIQIKFDDNGNIQIVK